MSSQKKKMIAGTVGTIFLLGISLTVFSWASDSSIRKVTSLQQQLYASGDMPRAEFNALKLDLMRTVDEMPRDKVRDLYANLEEKRRADELSDIEEFHASNDLNKEFLLDRILDQEQRSREIRGALRTDGVWSGRKRTKPDKEREAIGKKIKAAMDAGEITGEQAKDQWIAAMKQSRNEPELSEAAKAAKDEQRQLRDELQQALNDRAKVTGVERAGGQRGRGGEGRGRGGEGRGRMGAGRGPGK